MRLSDIVEGAVLAIAGAVLGGTLARLRDFAAASADVDFEYDEEEYDFVSFVERGDDVVRCIAADYEATNVREDDEVVVSFHYFEDDPLALHVDAGGERFVFGRELLADAVRWEAHEEDLDAYYEALEAEEDVSPPSQEFGEGLIRIYVAHDDDLVDIAMTGRNGTQVLRFYMDDLVEFVEMTECLVLVGEEEVLLEVSA
jgi:hypothetical protein